MRSRTSIVARTLVLLVALFLAGCTAGQDADGDLGGDGRSDSSAAQGAGVAALSAETTSAPASGVTVIGEGRAEGQPSRVLADLAVEVRQASVQEALEAASAAAADLIAALQDAGVEEADIQTRTVNVRPQMEEREPGQTPTPTGYVARNALRVTIDGVEQAGQVLQQAVDAAGDAARIDGVSLTLADDDELVPRAREQAFASARSTAEQYAELAGRTLGAVVRIAEPTGVGGPTPVAMEAAAADAGVPIQPGTHEVLVRVEVTWELQ